jgi:hypothetical protein
MPRFHPHRRAGTPAGDAPGPGRGGRLLARRVRAADHPGHSHRRPEAQSDDGGSRQSPLLTSDAARARRALCLSQGEGGTTAIATRHVPACRARDRASDPAGPGTPGTRRRGSSPSAPATAPGRGRRWRPGRAGLLAHLGAPALGEGEEEALVAGQAVDHRRGLAAQRLLPGLVGGGEPGDVGDILAQRPACR